MKKALLCLLLAATCLSGCTYEEAVSNENSSIVYEIFPSSFYDTNADGVGDINGIIQKLDYIQSLGAGSIWLTPVTDGESYHLYDVTNYTDIDPMLGTLDDFDRLVSEAKKRNISILVDLVLNHTSSKHPWFIEAKKDALNNECEKPGSKCQWYNFSNENGNGKTHLGNGIYYESGFWSEMPDLNLDNQEVRLEIEKIIKFWIDRGIGGFRLDAVYHYFAGNVEKNNEFLNWLNEFIDKSGKEIFVVGEVWSDQNTILSHYASGVDSFFNFPCSNTDGRIVNAIRKQSGMALSSWLADHTKAIREINPKGIDSIFLSNHDQGRSGAYFSGDIEKTRLMVSTIMFAPGKVFLYYGEEIGMLGSGEDPNKRLAMLWQNQSKEGIPFNPPGADYSKQKETSVMQQEKDQDSLLNFYRDAAKIRNKSTLYEEGIPTAIDSGNKSIYMMHFKKDAEELIVVHNFSETNQTVEIKEEISTVDSLCRTNQFKDGQLSLEPYSTSILYVKEK